MELFISVAAALLIIILTLAPYLSSMRIVSGEEIGQNINKLKRENWFNKYLNDERYKELIIHNNEVRNTIGRLHTNKLSKQSYVKYSKRKIQKIVEKQLSRSNRRRKLFD